MKLMRSLCIFLSFAVSVAVADDTPSLKQVLKTHKNHLLTPHDIAQELPATTQSKFPLHWKETHLGLIKQELTYTYHHKSSQATKTFIEVTTSLDPNPIHILIQEGIEYRKIGNTYKTVGHNSCLLTVGKCQYESLGAVKTSETKYKKGIWITKLDKAKIESVYDKNGLLLYRHHTTADGFETITTRIENP